MIVDHLICGTQWRNLACNRIAGHTGSHQAATRNGITTWTDPPTRLCSEAWERVSPKLT